MFIYEKAPFPSCHASTVVEHEPGKLLAAWFGGTDEGAKDVQIWSSAFDGKWSVPQVVGTMPGQPCWNPVLFKLADGGLVLWYKAGPSPSTWVGYERRSADGGKTWRRSNAFNVPGKHAQIQPSLFVAAAGRVVAVMRSFDPRKVCRAESTDGGVTFSAAAATDLDNPSTGVDTVTTKDGDVLMVCNPVPLGRTPLSIARSTDDGKTWKRVHDLETEPGEYSYPAMIVGGDGAFQITYTWRRTHIKHVTLDPATLKK